MSKKLRKPRKSNQVDLLDAPDQHHLRFQNLIDQEPQNKGLIIVAILAEGVVGVIPVEAVAMIELEEDRTGEIDRIREAVSLLVMAHRGLLNLKPQVVLNKEQQECSKTKKRW